MYANVEEKSTYISKCFATAHGFTDMRAFSRVRSPVDVQRTSLDEAFVAICDCATVRSIICMDS
jgi:hypothetical protein